MSIFHSIILAVVEGITEFLPISSTGHLILTSNLLGINQTDFVKSFEIIIQLGAILAVIYLYLPSFLSHRNLWPKLVAAFLPAAIIGFTLFKFIKGFLLGNTLVTLLSLFIGGLLLIILELIHREKEHHLDEVSQLDYRQAVTIGIFQSFSIIPGVSRSATTIVGGLLVGLKRRAAVEFSFLLAVPTMLAATTLDLYQSQFSFTPDQLTAIAIGFIVSFITAVFSIKFLISFVKKHTFIPFGIYRIALSILYWLIIVR